MKSFLQDVIAHTHSLGFLPLVKITSGPTHVEVDSHSDDRSIMLLATTFQPVNGLTEEFVFGLPNLNKLELHLKCPEYKKDAIIELRTEDRSGELIPTGLHFNNSAKDYENDYRFMNRSIIEDKVKRPKRKTEITYDIEFVPSASSIAKLKFQAAAHSEETVFQAATVNGNLIFNFGDASTHAGSFVFQPDITGTLKNSWSWSILQLVSILNLDGDLTMKISDLGVLQVIVDSGLATYTYTLPAQTK